MWGGRGEKVRVVHIYLRCTRARNNSSKERDHICLSVFLEIRRLFIFSQDFFFKFHCKLSERIVPCKKCYISLIFF